VYTFYEAATMPFTEKFIARFAFANHCEFSQKRRILGEKSGKKEKLKGNIRI
jgi:hypothetical protein